MNYECFTADLNTKALTVNAKALVSCRNYGLPHKIYQVLRGILK